LVFVGDLNDRGPESVNVMDCVMALQHDASAGGGAVHSLLGNHELLAVRQDYRYTLGQEFLAFEHYWYNDVNGLDAIYLGNGPYARWLRTRPTMLVAGSTMFVHAGLDAWVLDWDPARMNAVVAQWVAYFQGAGESPPEDTIWTIEEDRCSALWTPKFGTSQTKPPSAKDHAALAAWLARLGVTRLVVGHMVTMALDFAIAYPHPAYGESVAGIDTGISRSFGGRLSALEIDGSAARPHYFDRGSGDTETTKAVRAACEARRTSYGEGGGQ